MRRPALGRVYVITDRRVCADLPAAVAAIASAVPVGGAVFQVREKDLEGRALLELTRAVIAVARPRACPVLVNDRIDVAIAAGADGVHLPELGMVIADARAMLGDDALIGASTHDEAGVARAAAAGADLIVCGPVWPTPSKQGAPLGLDVFARAARLARDARLYALGGIDSTERARAARDAGAYGVGAIRAFIAGADHVATCAAIYGAIV